MALPSYLLVHTATPVAYVEAQSSPAEWIEGEPGPTGPEPVEGEPFPCVLFLPSPGGEQPNAYRPRVIREPTLLFNVDRDDGSSVILTNESEVLIEAPELEPWTGAAQARWQTVGDAQPFGPPGIVFGVMATLRMVRD